MLKLEIMRAINKFKKANNLIEMPTVDVELSLVDSLTRLNREKISTSWISRRDDLVDERNGLQVIINLNEFNKCNYLMIDLDRVKEQDIFNDLIDNLIAIVEKSSATNNLYIGYISKRISNPTPDDSFSSIKEFIKFSKSRKVEKAEAS